MKPQFVVLIFMAAIFVSFATNIEAKSGLKIICPPDAIHYSDDKQTRINWDRIKIIKAPDGMYPPTIRSNKRPGNMVSVPGVYEIRYRAKDELGNIARCNFTITVKRPSCQMPKVPKNGALLCDVEWEPTKKHWMCAIICKSGYDVPHKGTVFTICNKQKWMTYPGFTRPNEHCSVVGKGNLPPGFYYNGDITKFAVQEKMKSNFLAFIRNYTPFCFMKPQNCKNSQLKIYS